MGRRIYREEMSWKDFDGLKKGQEKGKGKENSKGKAKGKANCNDNAKSGNGPFNNPGQGKKLGLYKKYGENGKDHVYHKETTYLYEGLSNVLHKEYSATGSPYAEYYNGPDNEIVSRKMFGMHGLSNPAHDPALKTTGGMLYYQYDGTKAVSEVTDRHGDIIVRYRYDAFGSIFTGTTPPYNYNGYAGMRYAGKSGLVDMNARWYNPGTARFMSEDTYPGDFSQTQTLNRYAYVMNNPVNQWDPTGHMAELFNEIPSWVKAGETNLIQVGINTHEYWEPVHPGTSPTPVPSDIVLVNTSTANDGITDTYQQSFTTTWYYQYTTILIQDDIYKRLHDPREQSFSETETYQWDVFISAEEIAKGNQEKIRAMVGFPDDARLVSVDVSLPYRWDPYQWREFDKQFKVVEPLTPKNTVVNYFNELHPHIGNTYYLGYSTYTSGFYPNIYGGYMNYPHIDWSAIGSKVVSLPEEMRDWFVKTIDPLYTDKEEHYNRNVHNGTYPSIDYIKENWEKADEDVDIYHENTNKNNDKYWDSTEKKEIVINSKTNEIVTDSRDMGTYNYRNGIGLSHTWYDVIPYWIWGNTPDDPTPLINRIVGPFDFEPRLPNENMMLGGF